MRLDQLIAQADEVIEKRASKQEPPVTAASDHDEVVKLASFLENMEPGHATSEPSPFEMNFVEKLACSVAMVEALNNFEEFQKIAEFQEQALASGYTQAQVDEFLEKKALKVPASVTIPALALMAGGAAGHMHGKKKGYSKALEDVQHAFSQTHGQHE